MRQLFCRTIQKAVSAHFAYTVFWLCTAALIKYAKNHVDPGLRFLSQSWIHAIPVHLFTFSLFKHDMLVVESSEI